MTVAELIEVLKKMPQDAVIAAHDGTGWVVADVHKSDDLEYVYDVDTREHKTGAAVCVY